MSAAKNIGRLALTMLAGGLLLAACTKDLPSSPGTPPGKEVVFHNLYVRANASRQVIVNGRVYNQSGLTIYDVRIGMVTYFRTDTLGNFTILTDTSSADALVADSLPNKTESGDFSKTFTGDSLIDVYPVYTFNPY